MTGYLKRSDGQTIEVRNGLVVGRDTRCDVVLPDGKASRRHARFVVEGGVTEVEDLGSSNGTFLNGAKIERRMVRPGDELRIGRTVFVYAEEDPSDAAGEGVFEAEDELFGDEAESEPAPAPVPEPAAVVEFADEVVEVHKAVPRPKTPVSEKEPVVASSQKILQYSKHAGSGGVLGDDVTQMSPGVRALVFALILVGMVGVAWAVTVLVR